MSDDKATPSAIFDAIIAGMTGILLEGESDKFVLIDGNLDDLANTPGDRQYVVLGRSQPNYLPENGIGNVESGMTFELTLVYARTEMSNRKMIDDSAKINKALHTLQQIEPRIRKKTITPLDYDYDAIENGVVASWTITATYFGD